MLKSIFKLLFFFFFINHLLLYGQSEPRSDRKRTAKSNLPIPQLITQNGKHTFLVDGQPFIMLGAQMWNSSGWPAILDKTWPHLRQLNCNTLEVPLYWEHIEPEPGKFDFANLDQLIVDARRERLRLVLLWFASYKNGQSQYVPTWVKENQQEYPRMLDATGKPIGVLSSLSEQNRNADAKAFAAVMAHIRQIDEQHRGSASL